MVRLERLVVVADGLDESVRQVANRRVAAEALDAVAQRVEVHVQRERERAECGHAAAVREEEVEARAGRERAEDEAPLRRDGRDREEADAEDRKLGRIRTGAVQVDTPQLTEALNFLLETSESRMVSISSPSSFLISNPCFVNSFSSSNS